MKRLAITSLLFLLPACGTTKVEESLFQEPNRLMAGEINERVEQITYQHREELYSNLLWLAQAGEQSIPALLRGLDNPEPKVRSSCIWVLGRVGDRRTIPNIKPLVLDDNQRVRLEAARTLLVMGDVSTSPILIEGLDSEKVQVRYLCHEALKATSLRDFGYDHLSEDMMARQTAVYGWRSWWSEQSGDQFFASSYAEEYNIDTGEPGWQPDVHAVPSGETSFEETEAMKDESTAASEKTAETTPEVPGTTPEVPGTTPEVPAKTPEVPGTTPETAPETTPETTAPGKTPEASGKTAETTPAASELTKPATSPEAIPSKTSEIEPTKKG